MTTQPSNEREKAEALRRQLRENDAQCTEVIGQINQLTIQLHRAQLRLRTLEARRSEIRTELAKFLTPPAA